VAVLQLKNANYKTDDKRLLAPGERNILLTFDAQLSKELTVSDGKRYRNYVQNWTHADQSISWFVRLVQPAAYNISVEYNKESNTDSGTIILEIDGKQYPAHYDGEPAGNSKKLFIASVTLTPGEHTIVLKGDKYEGKQYMRPMQLVLE